MRGLLILLVAGFILAFVTCGGSSSTTSNHDAKLDSKEVADLVAETADAFDLTDFEIADTADATQEIADLADQVDLSDLQTEISDSKEVPDATDTTDITDTTEAVDGVNDTADAEVSTDTADTIPDTIEDIPVEDIPDTTQDTFDQLEVSDSINDAGQDIADTDISDGLMPEAKPAGFMITHFQLYYPKLCVPTGSICTDVQDIANQLINSHLEQGDMYIVGYFHDLQYDDSTTTLEFGNSDCVYDGLYICNPPTGPDTGIYADTLIGVTSTCSLGIDETTPIVLPNGNQIPINEITLDAPCFATPSNDVVLTLMNVPFGVKWSVVAGKFEQWPSCMPSNVFVGKIKPGIVVGYMPREIAQTIELKIQEGMSFTLDELIEQTDTPKKVIDGHECWLIVGLFEAEEVPLYLDMSGTQ